MENISSADYLKLNAGLKRRDIIPHKREGIQREGEFMVNGELPLQVVMYTVSEILLSETGKKFPFTVIKDKYAKQP